jgi:hypothetical protein
MKTRQPCGFRRMISAQCQSRAKSTAAVVWPGVLRLVSTVIQFKKHRLACLEAAGVDSEAGHVVVEAFL